MSRTPVAIAHDYLTQAGGAERVVLDLAGAFPDAPIYTTLYHPEGTFPEFAELPIRTGPLNRVGLLRRDHRLAFPALAPVVSRTRIDADTTIASSSGWAHGMRATGRLVVYCHAPARWLYQTAAYLGRDDGRNLADRSRRILADLAVAPEPWFSALRELTGTDPVPPADRARPRAAAEHWLAAGR